MSRGALEIHRPLQETNVEMLIFGHFSRISRRLAPGLSPTAREGRLFGRGRATTRD
jgi:hypothetical protein